MIIKINDHFDYTINKLIINHANFKIVYSNQDYILLKIDKKDYDKIKKLIYYSKISIIKKIGLYNCLDAFKKYKIDFIILSLIIIILFFISNLIVDIDIRHESSNVRDNINAILKKYNINKFSFAKSKNELSKINESIINNNDDIDWISIKKNGMKYIVELEDKVKRKESDNNNSCNIISKYNAIITDIKYISGNSNYEIGDYVKKNDVLISSDIKLNDEIKGNLCANGKVYGSIWLKVDITYPYKSIKKEKTNNKRMNIIINNKKIFRDIYLDYEDKVVFSFFDFNLINTYEMSYKTITLNKEQIQLRIKEYIYNELKMKYGNDIKYDSYKIIELKDTKEYINQIIFISLIIPIS